MSWWKGIVLIFLAVIFVISVFFVFKSPLFLKEEVSLAWSSKDVNLERYEKEKEVLPERSIPDVVRGIYVSGWSAGTAHYIDYIFDLVKSTKINAVIIDVKDYEGTISYESELESVIENRASRRRVPNMENLLSRLKEKGVYTIARVTVFQDSIFAQNNPSVAVQSREKLDSGLVGESAIWRDNKGVGWTDPSAKEVWDYNIEIAKEALELGFDEINFDYIRFPSDGVLSDMVFPNREEGKTRRETIKEFYEYLKKELEGEIVSADLFGLVCVNKDDLGIGQVIEDAFPYFDYISPMIYPSHYASGFMRYENPSYYPYEVVSYNLKKAQERLNESGFDSKIRPWLQDFSIRGVNYGKEEVSKQIKATKDALGENYVGYMLWSPRNIYTREAFK